MARVRIETLDHVALWVADRERLATFLTQHLGMHLIDRTERFTLVGSDARRGKLTLFGAEGPRQPGALVRVGLVVHDLGVALARLPATLEVARPSARLATFEAPEGLGLALVESSDERIAFDIDHVALRVPDPSSTFAELAELGFTTDHGRLKAGDASIELEQGDRGTGERPLLNHFGLRVLSVKDHLEEAERQGVEIADVVDAANTHAVFVWGPDRIKLEYVEHKASFSLV